MFCAKEKLVTPTCFVGYTHNVYTTGWIRCSTLPLGQPMYIHGIRVGAAMGIVDVNVGSLHDVYTTMSVAWTTLV